MAMAGEVTQHGQAHPYSWSITIVSLRSKERVRNEPHQWVKPNSWGMFLAVTCQHMSGACQSNSCPVLSLHEASRKYAELSPSTLPFVTLRFHEKDLTSTLNLLQIRPIFPLLGHILSYKISSQNANTSNHTLISWTMLIGFLYFRETTR